MTLISFEKFQVPVKYEHVVFCRLSEFQLSLYELFMISPEIHHLLREVCYQLYVKISYPSEFREVKNTIKIRYQLLLY